MLAAVIRQRDRRASLTDAPDTVAELVSLARPDARLQRRAADGCCDIRKVLPLKAALAPFDAQFTGRKAFQSKTRGALPRFEIEEGRLKVNPLADWDKARIAAYIAEHDLPPHPLVEQGYPSIGCSPCTTMVAPGEDERSGRWKGWDKVECGIHTAVPVADDNGANDPVF